MNKSTRLILYLSTLGIAVFAGMSCRLFLPDASPRLQPTAEASPTPDAIPTSPAQVFEPLPTSLPEQMNPVLSACDPGRQMQAMLASHAPDLEALGVGVCYQLTLVIDPDIPGYHGTARITFLNQTEKPLAELVLRLYPNAEQIYGGRLEIIDANLDGAPIQAEIFLPDSTGLRLALEKDLAPGEPVVIDLRFRGTTPLNLKSSGSAYGIYNYTSASQVMALANWYPMLAVWQEDGWEAGPVIGIGDAVVSETALYEVSISAPPGWQVVTTGSAIEETQGEGGMVVHYASGPVRDFMVVASPAFVLRKGITQDVLIRHWGLPGGETRWEEALQATQDSVGLFNQRFGVYPYAELDVVAVPLYLALGVEYPGLFLILDEAYFPDQNQPFLLGLVVSHEAAHQWWYSLVGNDVLADPWLDEALATFSSILYQQAYQQDAYQATLSFYESSREIAEKTSGDASIAQPLEAFQSYPHKYAPVVYQKGGLFFLALMERLGEEIFFAALGDYYQAQQYRLAEPENLLESFEIRCECDLETLYQEWGVIPP